MRLYCVYGKQAIDYWLRLVEVSVKECIEKLIPKSQLLHSFHIDTHNILSRHYEVQPSIQPIIIIVGIIKYRH